MRNISSIHKKGQVNTLAPAILTLVFAAVVLVFGIVISQEMRDVDSFKTASSVTNESTGGLNATGYIVLKEDGTRTESFSLTEIWDTNATGYTYIISNLASNFSIDSDTGNVTSLTAFTVGSNATVSYTYRDGGEAYEAGNKTVVGLGTFADFWEIIVLAIVITVVIGLLLVIFGGRRNR